MALGHFPEGEAMTDALTQAKLAGLRFSQGWKLGLGRARRGRSESNPHWLDAKTGLLFAREAFRRAYEGEEQTRQDVLARALLHAMEAMYDDSELAEATYVELMEAA